MLRHMYGKVRKRYLPGKRNEERKKKRESNRTRKRKKEKKRFFLRLNGTIKIF